MVSDVLVKRFPQYKFQTDNLDNPSPKPFADVSKVGRPVYLALSPQLMASCSIKNICMESMHNLAN